MTSEFFFKDVEDVLLTNILPYWSKLKDPCGGYYGRVTGTGVLEKDAPRGAILNARIIWAFSSVYRLLGRQEDLCEASHAAEYFLEHFIDHKYGGVYWSVDSEGRRLVDKAQLYAQGFGIYALSEYYAASGDEEALKAAVNIFRITEKHFADRENGGYIEALGRDFEPLEDMRLSPLDVNCQKTMNSHLHLLEGYANLYKVWPDKDLRESIVSLLDILECRIMNPSTGHLELYFDRDWTVVSGGVSYGHDIETSWLAPECAAPLKDFALMDRVRAFALRMYDAGLEGLQEDGSLIYEITADGKTVTDRHWWVQAEAVVGNLWAWKYQGVAEGARRAEDAWKYISSHLVDRKGGEWWWSCDANGAVNTEDDKAGEWKCPYHNSRMCLEALKIFA